MGSWKPEGCQNCGATVSERNSRQQWVAQIEGEITTSGNSAEFWEQAGLCLMGCGMFGKYYLLPAFWPLVSVSALHLTQDEDLHWRAEYRLEGLHYFCSENNTDSSPKSRQYLIPQQVSAPTSTAGPPKD